jgi:hypothetical protein
MEITRTIIKSDHENGWRYGMVTLQEVNVIRSVRLFNIYSWSP